jgi:hypothetical protein
LDKQLHTNLKHTAVEEIIDNQAMQPFFGIRTDLQTLFPNNKIVLNLVEDNFDNVVKRIE